MKGQTGHIIAVCTTKLLTDKIVLDKETTLTVHCLESKGVNLRMYPEDW